MTSVLDQSHPPDEYVVIDGGSSDESVAIIRSFADRLHYWVSEKDGGQYAAIQRGFEQTTGEIMGWLNSDDMYVPGALSVVAEIFGMYPSVEWISTLHRLDWDEHGRAVAITKVDGFSRRAFWRGEYLWCPGCVSRGFIQQESTFWRRSLWERAGGYVDASLRYAGDFELWVRFYREALLYGVNAPLGGFRRHGSQKSHDMAAYLREANDSLLRHGGRPCCRSWVDRARARVRAPIREALPRRLQPRRRDGDFFYYPERGHWELDQR